MGKTIRKNKPDSWKFNKNKQSKVKRRLEASDMKRSEKEKREKNERYSME